MTKVVVTESYVPFIPYPIASRDGLLFIGRLSSEKCPEIAIQAAKNAKIPLFVIGAGILPEIKSPLLHHVTRLTNAVVRFHLSTAFALLVPSQFDQSPKVIKEAHIHGCLVIATPITGIRDGRTGLCSNPTVAAFTEAIARAIALSDEERKAIRLRAYKLAVRRQRSALAVEHSLLEVIR